MGRTIAHTSGPTVRMRAECRPSARTRAARIQAGDAALLGIFGLCLAVALLALALRPAPPSAASWTPVTIGEHSTLWDVARAHPVPGLSTAETVALIRTHNGLETPDLVAGQPLFVPASLGPDGAVGRR